MRFVFMCLLCWVVYIYFFVSCFTNFDTLMIMIVIYYDVYSLWYYCLYLYAL